MAIYEVRYTKVETYAVVTEVEADSAEEAELEVCKLAYEDEEDRECLDSVITDIDSIKELEVVE